MSNDQVIQRKTPHTMFTNAFTRRKTITRLFLALILFLTIGLVALAMLLYFMVAMPGTSVQGDLPDLDQEQTALAVRLRNHVNILADVVGPRHEDSMANLDRAADYINTQLQSYGYETEAIRFGDDRFRNIQATLSGSTGNDEIIVLGAHYDTARTGTPGADDNASGVSVLLELARMLADKDTERTIRFFAFANEEQPFSETPLMGSRVSANQAAESKDNIVGMFSLEMLGYYSDEPGSQKYPPVVRQFYPDTGNFVAFVGNLDSRLFLSNALALFRAQKTFPSEGMAAPEFLVGDIRRSDHASYWDVGYPAVMVTDTSNFRSPHYHTLGDTPQTLDYESMARLTEGLSGMVFTLANAVE